METTLFLEASGFVVGFILLFVFTAKYRAALARETDFDSSVEEMKIRCEKANDELVQQLARLEERVATFEQEYVNKLQPTLMSLIEELENMKVAELQEK